MLANVATKSYAPRGLIMKVFILGIASLLLTTSGCTITQLSCQEKIALVLESTCSPQKKNKLAYAVVSGCSRPYTRAYDWGSQLTTLTKPLQCEKIPTQGFEYSWNAATTPEPKNRIFPKAPSREVRQKPGTITKQIVRDAMYPIQIQAKRCYKNALRIYPNLSGKITTYFEVDTSGVVLRAGIQSTTMYHHGVESCLLKVVKRVRFPESKDGRKASITYPWVFKQGRN